jgi:hypothetical protein
MQMSLGSKALFGAMLAGALFVSTVGARAQDDGVNELANAICKAPDFNGVLAALASFAPEDEFAPETIAEAFGVATFLSDLSRCTNRQAIADSFAYYKKNKDAAKLDASFAVGRVTAKPASVEAGEEVYQGSFATLGTAGDAPSGQ